MRTLIGVTSSGVVLLVLLLTSGCATGVQAFGAVMTGIGDGLKGSSTQGQSKTTQCQTYAGSTTCSTW